MIQTRGIRPSGHYYSPIIQTTPLQNPAQQGPAAWLWDKKKVKNLIIQSYWVIWLFLSFIIAYLLGFLILESPIVIEYDNSYR